MRVLIGYDATESSEVIFDDLRLAGLPRECDALVVTVGDLLVNSPPAQAVGAETIASQRVAAALRQADARYHRVIDEAEETASRASDQLCLLFPEWEIESRVVTGDPAWKLINAANDWNADLVVVGSKKRSAINRLLLGSVSKTVVTDSRRSVRVARPIERKKVNAPPRIIIGVDGSAAAEEAVMAVGRRVWQDGAQVRLIAVHDRHSSSKIAPLLPQAADVITEYNQNQARRADLMIEWAMYQLKSIGLNVSMSIQKGDPKRILLREAERWRADCIFVGTRDFKNSLERFRLGSVSTAVVTRAQCSVEVVRPAEIEREKIEAIP